MNYEERRRNATRAAVADYNHEKTPDDEEITAKMLAHLVEHHTAPVECPNCGEMHWYVYNLDRYSISDCKNDECNEVLRIL